MLISDLRMSRARLYVLLDSFEQDMREIVEHYLLDHMSEEEVLGTDFQKAAELRTSDVGEEVVPIVHYLYLRQCYDIINRHRNKIPNELSDELRHNTARMDELVPIRNRVMHGRPMHGDDPETALSVINSFTSRHWRNTRDALAHLSSDAAWEPPFDTQHPSSERILHNLPLADYDETGLVGRGEDVTRLKTLIQRRREPIITITGEGGIGKTALALEVAYSIVDDAASGFDCVLWVSLKSEILTASGVRTIEGAIQGITGATRELGSVIDRTFSGSIEDLSEALAGISALIVIDNLESAQGDEIIRLYDTLPTTVSYLFTSRVGVGQVERRVPLGPLNLENSRLLFRKLAATRQLKELLRLSRPALDSVLERLRHSPLAIKWYVLSVEAGKEPLPTLRDQQELIEFCIRNVFDALSTKAKALLIVLDAVDRSVSFDELAVLTEMPIDDLRSAAQELGRGALIAHEPDPKGGLVAKLTLTPAARIFLKTQPGRDTSLSEIRTREELYRRSAERRRAGEALRSLGPNVVRARTTDDEPVVHLLHLALQHSKRGELTQAQDLIARARAINPDYWEVDRVAAFIASTQRRAVEATTLYQNALANTLTDEERAVVSHFLAGHLARTMRDVDAALPHAEAAHTILQSHDTALQLGNLKIWIGDFASGQMLLEIALEGSTGKTNLIAATSLVESWRRWAESSIEARNLTDAVDKAHTGFNVGIQTLGDGVVDLRLASETLESANVCVRAMIMHGSTVDEYRLGQVLSWLESHSALARGARSWGHLRSTLLSLLRDSHVDGNLASRIQSTTKTKNQSTELDTVEAPECGLVGEVISWAGRYGFIKHPDYPSNVFFHRGGVRDLESLTRGAVVQFDIDVDNSSPNSNLKAKNIVLANQVGSTQ